MMPFSAFRAWLPAVPRPFAAAVVGLIIAPPGAALDVLSEASPAEPYVALQWLDDASDDTPITLAQARPRLPIEPGGGRVNVPPVDVADRLWANLSNWGFEHGLTGWTKSGTAFDAQPTYGDNVVAARVINPSSNHVMPLGGDYWREVPFPIGHKGNRWIGTYERHPGGESARAVQGDAPTGTLTSRPFTVSDAVISFLIGGGYDPARLTVSLFQRTGAATADTAACAPPAGAPRPADGPAPMMRCPDGVYTLVAGTPKTGFNVELMRREWWDVRALAGRTVRIRIVDEASGGWGHINVDDFRFEARIPTRTPAPVGGPHVKMVTPHAFRAVRAGLPAALGFVDWDAPVWGVADLHTHPMSHLGFGGKLVYGRPDGDLATELASCNAAHGGYGLDNTGGNYLRALIVNLVDKSYRSRNDPPLDHAHQGAPALVNWPHFSSATHQQMRWEWIKRAKEGGLRVMVALAVNNQLLADAIDGDGAHTATTGDKASADLQIQAMKDFVAWVKRQPGGDFLDIVYDPAALRQTVRRGKLAVVLGVEVDDLGDFNRIGVDRRPEAVRREIRRLHAAGVRYAFPVHVSDNAFGGAAIYDQLFNYANRYSAVQPLPPDIGAWAPGTAYRIEHAPDPELNYQLKPLLDIPGSVLFGLRSLLDGFENLPSPAPNGCFPCPDWLNPISIGIYSAHCEGFKAASGLPLNTADGQTCAQPLLTIRQLFNQRQYTLITRFFLTPDPVTDTYAFVPPGHRNVKGMTPLGEIAINEMMRLGMIIDIDHMSEKTAARALEIAESIRGGYPLVSGHTGFRAMQSHEVNENQRSDDQLRRLERLGGMMGIGWGYSTDPAGDKTRSFARVIAGRGGRGFTSSNVDYDGSLCAGTSRTFAQNYLYGVEKIGAVALGSDLNGVIAQPGPRFGAQATLGGNLCRPQRNSTRVNYVGGRAWSSRVPLLPATALSRTYDINLDGVAHYGLLPDFFQDLSQVGINANDMSHLFRSAETFAQTWTKAVATSAAIR
jgi:microsomal dipeptidase-like Zn-dependent dipeptidase